jgi:type IV pilus assembly protein PilM
MAPATDAVWAIDLGNNSLKALHLTASGGVAQVIGFDNIQHGKILTGSGIKPAEREELIALSLRQFVQRNDIGEDEIIISVPSQNSFARFVDLPPVEQKRIPEIVRFEAVQQIPFDIDDVQWDWQMMSETDSAEKKVGIFAIKNEVVDSALEHFGHEDLQVSYVQMTPMALYNYLLYDRPDLVSSDNKAIVIINIGAENTDLVVCTESMVWQRCILIGGNAFTRAIADAFRLNFEKAEKLKRTAPVSKYARQIFQAMRPVFTDLASELQRSLGFYTSAHPNTKFARVIALGGGTKLRGLLKYLQQTLQVPVQRPDSFKRLAMSPAISAAKFHENVSDFGVVYGLGLQALGLARIESNLLPRSIARSMAWAQKSRYFTAAACLLLLVSALCLARTFVDKFSYARNKPVRAKTTNVLNQASQVKSKLQNLKTQRSTYEAKIEKAQKPFEYREVLPELYETLLWVLPNAENTPQQADLYKAFEQGDVEKVIEYDRHERRQLFVTSVSAYFSQDLANAQFGSTAMTRRGARIRTEGEGFGEDYMMEEYMMMEEMGMGRGSPYQYQPPSFMLGGQEQVEKHAGFVVTLVGYSPYANISALLDPPRVEGDRDQWGVVTRLMRLDGIVDGNSPFALYEKTDPNQFKLDYGVVDLETDMPPGIGVPDVRFEKVDGTGGQQVLIDPMTKEIISKVPVFDEYGQQKLDDQGEPRYKINDRWFVLNVKLKWKEAPAAPEASAGPGLPGAPRLPGGTARPAPARQPARPSSTGGTRKPLGIDDF